MKKYLFILTAVAIGGFAFQAVPTQAATCIPVTSVYPGGLDNFTVGDCIPSALTNVIESTIGTSTTSTAITTQISNLLVQLSKVLTSINGATSTAQTIVGGTGTSVSTVAGATNSTTTVTNTGVTSLNSQTGAATYTVNAGTGITVTTSTTSSTVGLTSNNVSQFNNDSGYVLGAGNGVAGDCVKWGTSSTLVDALAPCGSGGGGNTSSSAAGPFYITGPNGTSTIYGNSSSSYIYNINGNPQIPSPAALALGALCGTTYPVYDAGACIMDWQSYLGTAATYMLGPYTYNYSYPIIYKQYNLLKGNGQTLLSFTPTYYNVTSANSSTKVISYSSVGSPTYFNGEAVTAVGASLPSGIVIGKLYYVGNLTSSTLVLYTNSALTATSSVTGTGVGTLETPALTGDGGQNPSYGWGSDGVSYNGPNNGSSTGIFIGGPNGARSFTLANGSVTHFYYNIEGGDNSYFVTIFNFYDYRNAPNTNSTTYGGLFWMDASTNSGEEWNWIQSVTADAEPANNTLAVDYAWDWQTSGFVDVECNGSSWDDAGRYFNTYDGEGNSLGDVNCHDENPGSDGGGWGAITFLTTPIGNPNTSIDIDWTNETILNNANGGNTPPMVLNLGPGAMFNGNGVSVQNNNYVSATQIPLFATIANGSLLTVEGFHNIGDTPGVTYLYNTRVPVAGIMTNAASLFDGTVGFTQETTQYNNAQLNPIINVVSTTLAGYMPNLQEVSSSAPITITFPTIANNTGSWFDVPNIGSATETIITATSTDLFRFCPANTTATSGVISVGHNERFVDDTKYWTQYCFQ